MISLYIEDNETKIKVDKSFIKTSDFYKIINDINNGYVSQKLYKLCDKKIDMLEKSKKPIIDNYKKRNELI